MSRVTYSASPPAQSKKYIIKEQKFCSEKDKEKLF